MTPAQKKALKEGLKKQSQENYKKNWAGKSYRDLAKYRDKKLGSVSGNLKQVQKAEREMAKRREYAWKKNNEKSSKPKK